MGSSPVANPVCWGSIIAIPLNLTIPLRTMLADTPIPLRREPPNEPQPEPEPNPKRDEPPPPDMPPPVPPTPPPSQPSL